MAERRELLRVHYISDHSCGSYQIGEIDTLPDVAIEEHIKNFGEYGYEQLRTFAIRMIVKAENQIYKHRLSNSGASEDSARVR